VIPEQRLREIARIVSQGHTASHDYSEFVSACAELLAARETIERLTEERDSEAREAAGYQKIAREVVNAEEPGLLVLLVDQQGAEVRIFGPDRDAEERFGEAVARWWKLLQATSEGLELEERTKERDAARAEAERVTEQRDTLLAAVMDGTAEFREWQECEADAIEGQEAEVERDHNRMLAALHALRRKAKHVQNGTRFVVEAGSLPAHLQRAEQPKPVAWPHLPEVGRPDSEVQP